MSIQFDWPRAVRDDVGLSPTAKHLALTLALRLNEEGVCWPSIERLATETGLGEKTVRRRRDELIERGWLDVERRRGRRGRGENVSVYHATFPEGIWSQRPDSSAQIRSPVPGNPVTRSPKSGHGDHRSSQRSSQRSRRRVVASSNGRASASSFEQARQFVIRVGWEYPERALREELVRRFDLSDDQRERLVALAVEGGEVER